MLASASLLVWGAQGPVESAIRRTRPPPVGSVVLWTLAPAAAAVEADEPAESSTVSVAIALGNAVAAGAPEEAGQGAQHVGTCS
jgi:hypothetical protein